MSRRSSGVLLHVTSLPGGRLGSEAYEFVDWLVEAGQSWWQVLPLNPPDPFGSPYTSSSAFAGWSGLLAGPDAAVKPAEIAGLPVRQAYWARDWERYAGAGALDDQVRFEREWQALRAVRDRARRPADRRHPDLRRRGQRRDRVPSRALRPRPRRRRRPRRLAPRGPALGAAGVRLAGDAPRGLPLVDRALPPDAGARRRRPGRPLPRLRRVLGRAARRDEPARRPLAPRRRERRSSRPSSASSATCR